MHELVLLCINQHTTFEMPSFIDSKDIIGVQNCLKTAQVTLNTPIKGYFVIWRLTLDIFYLHTKFGDSCFSAVLETWLPASKLKISHVTLTTPLYGWFVVRKLWLDTIYLYAKFDDSSFSRFRDIIGAQNIRWITWPWPRPF